MVGEICQNLSTSGLGMGPVFGFGILFGAVKLFSNLHS
jgi:hypothetical protein